MADISKIKTLNGTTYDIKDAKAVHNVYNGLDSTSASDALSANQGRVLNEKLDTLNSNSTAVRIGTEFSVTTNGKGIASVPSASIPTISGKTRAMVSLANYTSADLSASQIPPTIIETGSGSVYILGSPNKKYNGLQVRGLFI